MYKLEDYHIDFISEGHEYYVNGVRKPCLSDQIYDLIQINDFDKIPPHILANAALTGTRIHKAIELDLTVGVNFNDLHDSIKGLFTSYLLYKEENKLEPELVEKKLYCPSKDYCLTLDFKGKSLGRRILVDWKKGGIYKTYRAQIGGQLRGLMDYFDEPFEYCACVQLFKNGKIAKEHIYDQKEALLDFDSINRVYNLKHKKG